MGLSVSRVGGNAQIKAMKKIAGRLRLDLAQYRELQAFAQFGSELDKATQAQLSRGQRLTELLKQDQFKPLAVDKQIVVIFAGTQGYVDDLPISEVRPYEKSLLDFLDTSRPGLLQKIREKRELDDPLREEIHTALKEHKERFTAERSALSDREPGRAAS